MFFFFFSSQQSETKARVAATTEENETTDLTKREKMGNFGGKDRIYSPPTHLVLRVAISLINLVN